MTNTWTSALAWRLGSPWIRTVACLVIGLCATHASLDPVTHRYPVRIDSAPSGAELYLIRYTTWEVGDGPRLLRDYLQAPDAKSADQRLAALKGFLADYRVDQGDTPQELLLPAHQFLVVAVSGRLLGRATVTPRPTDDDDLWLQLRAVH